MNTLDIRKQGSQHGAIGHIWLNRPKLRNAFNDATIREITEAFQSMGSDPDIRVIVMGAHGDARKADAPVGSVTREVIDGSNCSVVAINAENFENICFDWQSLDKHES